MPLVIHLALRGAEVERDVAHRALAARRQPCRLHPQLEELGHLVGHVQRDGDPSAP
jgi:hypothetical protein